MKNTKIYRVLKKTDNIIEPDISSIKDLIQKDYHSIDNWTEIALKWFDGVNEPMRDFIFIYGSILVCNQKAYDIIAQLSRNIIFLPILIENQHFYIINIPTSEADVLDKRSSKIDYFSDKTIMAIRKYVFKPFIPQNSLFKIAESHTALFATEEFVTVLKITI